MFRKLLLVAAAAVAVSATAFAQGSKNVVPGSKAEKFYQVVPEHEFTVNGFGGMSTLMYKVDGTYYIGYGERQQRLLLQTPAVKADIVNFSNGPFHPTGLGGGGGFGYIWHFHPNVGLMTGLDIAYYSGGVRDLGVNKESADVMFPLASSYIKPGVTEDGDKADFLMGYAVAEYSEMQKYLALQIPIMFQFMAPMGQGNHHFYAAVGARLGLGVWNNYKGKGGQLYSTGTPYDYFPYTTELTHLYYANQGYIVLPMYNWDGPGDYFDHPGKYPWLVNSEATPTGTAAQVSYEPSGKWGAKLVNVMVSAELGFRWNLGRSANNYGFGLYTALYADYGVMTVNKKENVALITGYDHEKSATGAPSYGPYETHSVLNAQNAPCGNAERDMTPGNAAVYYKYEPIKPLAKAHTLAAGLKLKFAFGKVLPVAPPAPPVLPKPDTVTKIVYVRDTVQNTVVVRDTVQNTVVVRDTVTNTVVVRDTVTIIKEVPVEIQQTMRDLSNTLFEFNKFNVGEKARGYLDEIVDWLVENPKVNVEIGGHTDGIGSQEYNQKLSEQRAKTVYNYFVEHGVNKDRLSYKGYGKLEPIADNNTDAGRQQNRRVELKIIND